MSPTVNSLLLGSPLGTKLTQLSNYLLAKIRQERAISEEELDRMESLGSGDSRFAALVKTYLLLDRVMTVPGGLQPLDPASQLLVDAILDTPVPAGGCELKAFPKAYRVLGLMEFAEILAARGRTPEDRAAAWETARRIRAWIATTDGPSAPFSTVSESEQIPAFIVDLSGESLNAVELAFFGVNRIRNEALIGGPMNLADPTYTEYVPEVFKRLSRRTEIDAESLMRDCSYGKVLALDKLAETVIPGGL